MSQIKNITVKDGTTDVVFVAQMPQSGDIPAKWVNREGARNLQQALTAYVRPRTNASLQTDKTVIRYELPIKDAVTGALIRTYNAKLEVILPVSGTDAEAARFIGLLKNIIGHADVVEILTTATPAV